ncbi:MAG: putative metal-binding motif-containing protein [Sandaracinaceae bacterium]|nr:putative metal-binding motif-containing protein [Myxococcales bacterium]MCB9659397.1 putative metal-binding motif-containing protein [Sandaracinaceae bacterium]
MVVCTQGRSRFARAWALIGVVGLGLAVAGCGGDLTPPGDAGGTCASPSDCDDGLFCNGAEQCAPGDPNAGADGCVAGTPPCAVASCDETGGRCDTTDCTTPDVDGDGYDSVACGGSDCDDDDADRNPGAPERCEGMLGNGQPAADHDEDCNPCTVRSTANGSVDGDMDIDGYPADTCSNPWDGPSAPSGCDPMLTRRDDDAMTVHGSDCDDDASGVHPNLLETCDEVDNDCDGTVDNGSFFFDADGDGYGDAAMPGTVCGPRWVSNDDDCDDTHQFTYPGATERCDGKDNDCSLPGAQRGGPDTSEDADGDQHTSPLATCLGRGEVGALGWEYVRDDCNDGEATIYAGAPEICGNNVDENCNLVADDPMRTVYADTDGDGHGNPSASMQVFSCGAVVGYADVGDDCDDTRGNRFPGNTEVCDRIDNDCSAGSPVATEEDSDNDGHAAIGAPCAAMGELGATPGAFPRDDCNDAQVSWHPGATESCNMGEDRNCNGQTGQADAACACTNGMMRSCGTDRGECTLGNQVCGVGTSGQWGTCSTTLPGTNPDTACDGDDDDCDGRVDEAPVCTTLWDAGDFNTTRLNCAGSNCFTSATDQYGLLANEDVTRRGVYTRYASQTTQLWRMDADVYINPGYTAPAPATAPVAATLSIGAFATGTVPSGANEPTSDGLYARWDTLSNTLFLQFRSGGTATTLDTDGLSASCRLYGNTATATHRMTLEYTTLFGAATSVVAEVYRGNTLCGRASAEIGLDSPENGPLLALLQTWRAKFFYGVWSTSSPEGALGYFDTARVDQLEIRRQSGLTGSGPCDFCPL